MSFSKRIPFLSRNMLTGLLLGMLIIVILLLLLLIFIKLRCHRWERPQKILYRHLSTLLILLESTKDFNNSNFFREPALYCHKFLWSGHTNWSLAPPDDRKSWLLTVSRNPDSALCLLLSSRTADAPQDIVPNFRLMYISGKFYNLACG